MAATSGTFLTTSTQLIGEHFLIPMLLYRTRYCSFLVSTIVQYNYHVGVSVRTFRRHTKPYLSSAVPYLPYQYGSLVVGSASAQINQTTVEKLQSTIQYAKDQEKSRTITGITTSETKESICGMSELLHECVRTSH